MLLRVPFESNASIPFATRSNSARDNTLGNHDVGVIGSGLFRLLLRLFLFAGGRVPFSLGITLF